jgi:hypothetical protein
MQQRKRLFNRGREGAAVTVGAVVMLEVVDERGVPVRAEIRRSAQQHIAELGRDIVEAPDLEEMEADLALATAERLVKDYAEGLGFTKPEDGRPDNHVGQSSESPTGLSGLRRSTKRKVKKNGDPASGIVAGGAGGAGGGGAEDVVAGGKATDREDQG